ncbi:MAG TPA: hypothetical protein EYH30_05155 [Anaerolineales bacterium]|nr:hypothetical protein [Anaerolineales bacterium]
MDIENRLDLSRAATPRLLRRRPVHRWFAFPHSYSPELVEAVLEARQLGYRALGGWIVRLRGNSAQQMGGFGRVPSRETVVFLEVGNE